MHWAFVLAERDHGLVSLAFVGWTAVAVFSEVCLTALILTVHVAMVMFSVFYKKKEGIKTLQIMG